MVCPSAFNSWRQQYIRASVPSRNDEYILETPTDAPAEKMAVAVAVATERPTRAPMLSNYFFSAWREQRGTYSSPSSPWAKPKWEESSSPVGRCTRPASLSSARFWEIALKQWKGVGPRTKWLVAPSLFVLVASTAIVRYGNISGSPRRLQTDLRESDSSGR